MERKDSGGLARRSLVKGGAAIGAMSLAGPAIIRARGETPVKLGYIDPLTGVYSALAQDEVQGARYAVKVLNRKGGILGRPIELLVEDSANDVGTGVAKAHKLIDKDHVNAIFGDVNSGIAYAIAGVTYNKKVFQIVPGGHTDPITGKDCHWNVFRICNTTSMDANAITPLLVKHFGKRWYFITPNYAYGHTLQAAFIKALKKLGGEYEYSMPPINASDFSADLIKAKAYKPDVLLNNMGGLAQIDCMKQFVQFGMDKEIGLGGALFEVEDILGVPPVAQRGWWDMEWWWNQPKVPEVVSFVKEFRASEGRTPTARNWFGWVAVHSVQLAAAQAKSLQAEKLAQAMAGMELPPEVKLQPGRVFYRAGDHELMPNIFVGRVHPAPKGGDKDDVFTVAGLVPGDKIWPLADTGCHMSDPA
jgi:branched-chain amino acid transport system substrate-binding protein